MARIIVIPGRRETTRLVLRGTALQLIYQNPTFVNANAAVLMIAYSLQAVRRPTNAHPVILSCTIACRGHRYQQMNALTKLHGMTHIVSVIRTAHLLVKLPPQARAVRDSDVLLFVCSFVCLSVANAYLSAMARLTQQRNTAAGRSIAGPPDRSVPDILIVAGAFRVDHSGCTD